MKLLGSERLGKPLRARQWYLAEARYDAITGVHHHAICTKCGATYMPTSYHQNYCGPCRSVRTVRLKFGQGHDPAPVVPPSAPSDHEMIETLTVQVIELDAEVRGLRARLERLEGRRESARETVVIGVEDDG